MNSRTTLGIVCTALALCAVPDVASSQCVEEHGSSTAATTWRQRLAPWVPTVTLEVSNQLTQDASTRSRTDSSAPLLGPPTSFRHDQTARALDWRVAARWNVVELVESLAPVPEDIVGEDSNECHAPLGEPTHLHLEEAK